MNTAIKISPEKAKISAKQSCHQYNKKNYGNDVTAGDRVLLRNFSERGGTGKLRSHWEDTIYAVIEKIDKLPFFIEKIEKFPVFIDKPKNSISSTTKMFIKITSCHAISQQQTLKDKM